MKTFIVIVIALVAGCASTSWIDAWDARVANQQLRFRVPRDSSDALWNRARHWFGGNDRPGLSLTEPDLLQSATSAKGVSFTVLRSTAGDSVEIEVRQTSPISDGGSIRWSAIQQARDFAHYIQHGEDFEDWYHAWLARERQ
jgi:hypothetical protein